MFIYRITGKLAVWAFGIITFFTVTLNTYLMLNHMERFYPAQLEPLKYRPIAPRKAALVHRRQDLNFRRNIDIEVYSSKDAVYVSVDGIKVLESSDSDGWSPGIYIVVLNQRTASVMATRRFDVLLSQEESAAMVRFLNMLSDGRIVCLAIKDEGTKSLRKAARNLLRRYGSIYADGLEFRDTWAMILTKQGKTYAEEHSSKSDDKWGDPVVARATVVLSDDDVGVRCDWGNGDQSKRRKAFCDRYEGYEDICRCSNPASIDITSPTLPENRVADIPVVVVASNRPLYLIRALRSILSAHGANKELITVYIDGFLDETVAVAKLFGIKTVQHAQIGIQSARISQHYKRTLTETFDKHPEAKYMIILEEDLDVSVDIFSFFSQLLPLMDEDESIYCISAWNDQGYNHTCKDPSMLYRMEGMPGLGWLLKRRLYKEEIEAAWPAPDKIWDWDIWMRSDGIRKERECIIPDVSRTYHFGSKGLNVNMIAQREHFARHAFNTVPNVKFDVEQMKKENYEAEIDRLLSLAIVLDHAKDPCKNNKDFIPDTSGKTYVFYIEMEHSDDRTWQNMARCLRIWYGDPRGRHKSMWRLWLKGNHVLIVGSPASPYAKHKPNDIQPISIPKKTAT